MAATGNVKISELTNHSNVDGREVLPISWEQTPGSGYESYKVSFDSLKSYVGQSLDITGNNGLAARVTSYGNEISYLMRDLGRSVSDYGNIDYTHTEALAIGTENYVINASGVATAKSGYSISDKITVKKGTLYFFKLSADVPTDVSLFAKRHVHVYYPITGYQDVTTTLEDGTNVTVREPIYGKATEQVTYEPLPTQYMSIAAGGYGRPASRDVVFYAIEDEDIVISAPTIDIFPKNLYATTHYAIFSEIANKFIGSNTDISRVIAEAIAQLEGRVEACEGNVGSIGYATALQIDNMKMPKYRGGEMMIISDHAPSSVATPTKPADVPNHPGQIWIDTANQKVYFAISAGTYAGWKNITLS